MTPEQRMTALELHAALVDRTEREGIDLLEQALDDTYLSGFHAGREAAAREVAGSNLWTSTKGHLDKELIAAIRALEPKP